MFISSLNVGPKIKVDVVGFYAGPNNCLCRDIEKLCHDIAAYVCLLALL